MRAVLAPLADLAQKYNVAVVIVCHRRKGNAGTADETAMGSRAFTGIVRVAWHLNRDPGDKSRRLLLNGKNNLAPECDGLAFTISGQPIGSIVWEPDPVAMSADDAMSAERQTEDVDPKRDDTMTKMEQAQHFVADALQDGPRPWDRIRSAGSQAGHSPATLERARTRVAETFKAAGSQGGWFWRFKGDTRNEPVAEPGPPANDPPLSEEVGEDGKVLFLTSPTGEGSALTTDANPVPKRKKKVRQLRQVRSNREPPVAA